MSGEGKLFSLIHAFSRAAFFKAGALSILLLTSGMVLSSCMNVEEPAVEASTSDGEQTDASTEEDEIQLLKILPSQQSPGTQFDLVGDDDQFETICSNSSSPCFCEYTFTPPNGSEQIVLGNVTYTETNLLRCANTVPSTVSSFEVRIIQNDAASGTQKASNVLNVSMSSGAFAQSDSFLDLESSESYVSVKRFQCRKRAFIPNPMDTDIIDPFQSEDPDVIYPFNFFTTNVGESIVELQRASVPSGTAGQSGADWDCTLTPNADRTVHWWANPFVFSKSECTNSFCSGDEFLIYPKSNLSSGPIDSQNATVSGLARSSFMLVPRPYGVFQIPVRAPVAPTSNYRAPSVKVIGYAAKPLPAASGASRCPSIDLPENHRWVKLWPYRADLPSPVYVKQSGSPALQNTVIGCNPFNAGPAPNDNPVFPSCEHNGFGTVVGNGVFTRVGIIWPLQGGVPPNACYKITSEGLDGIDEWTPSTYTFHDTVGAPTQETFRSIPWNIYSEATIAGNVVTNPNAKTPAETIVATQKVSTEDFVDWLFVTTPEVHPTSSVNIDDAMRNPASGYGNEFRPVTFRNSSTCDPGNGLGDANCIETASGRVEWGLMGGGIGNPSGSSNNLYPLCVVQKNE